MSALTLNDVRAREAIIKLGRSGRPIRPAAVAAVLRRQTDLSRSELLKVARAEIEQMRACEELYYDGGRYSLHPALYDSTMPLFAAAS